MLKISVWCGTGFTRVSHYRLKAIVLTINCTNHFYGLTVQCKPKVFLKDLN